MKQYSLFFVLACMATMFDNRNLACSTVYQMKNEIEIAKKIIPPYQNLAHEINKTKLDLALEELLHPKYFLKENERLLLLALKAFDYNSSMRNERVIKKLLKNGANFCRIPLDKFSQETMQRFNLAWQRVPQNQEWEENHSHLPNYILKRFRYGKNFKHDTPKNRLVFCLVHGTGPGIAYTTFYDAKTKDFQGILEYAGRYLENYNQKNNSSKILHLLSYIWSGEYHHTSRKKDGKKLAHFLNSAPYAESDYSFLGYSHGCSLINEALYELERLQKRKLYKKNIQQIKPSGLAESLIYFFPPCREPFSQKMDILNKLFGYSLSEPTCYNQLSLFYSNNDITAQLGAIDKISGSLLCSMMMAQVALMDGKTGLALSAGAAAGAANVGLVKALGAAVVFNNVRHAFKDISREDTKNLCLKLGYLSGLGVSAQLIKEKTKNAFYYHNTTPKKLLKNSCLEIKGPKNQIELMIDGVLSGHSVNGLFPLLSLIEQQLNTYPGHRKSSAFFKLNLDKNGNALCFLDEPLNDTHHIDDNFTEENLFLKKRNFLTLEDMKYAEQQNSESQKTEFEKLYNL